ncbi:MAG: putative lipid II flippase FtsW [Cocleimonas sp.]
MFKDLVSNFQPSWQRYVDRGLLLSVALLIGLGLVIMMSASVAVAERNYGDMYFFLKRQVLFLMLGLVVAYFIYRIKTSVWQRFGAKLLPIVLLLLVAVLLPVIGKEVNGSHRWINLGPISLQVSEMAKLIMIMYMSGYLVRHGKELAHSNSYQPLIIPLLVLGLTDALLMLEPDFGSVVVLTATGIALLFLGGLKLTRLAMLFIGAVAVMIPLVMMGYRGERVMAFLDPWSHASGKAYQTVHALMAVGDGGWFGAGLGASVQKLFYLPEAHNDFIFAVLAEEMGFVGIVIILFLYAWFVQRAFVIGFRADRANLNYAAYLAYGIGFWVGFQVLFHIGVNLALLPPKGLTLPLISYGGSSLLVTLMAIALLMRVHRDTQIALFGVSDKEAQKQRQRTLKQTRRTNRGKGKSGASYAR